MGEYSSTDLVVGEDIRRDARLILTCIAHHGPAEWYIFNIHNIITLNLIMDTI